MKKKHALIVFTIILLGLAALVSFNKSNTLKEDVALKNSIIQTVEKSKEIDFSKIANFEWDTMYVFTPYSNPKNILKKDGITTYNSKFNIEALDNINMIGFVNSNKLVAFVELPRNYGGTDLTNYIKFDKNESKFNILADKKAIVLRKS